MNNLLQQFEAWLPAAAPWALAILALVEGMGVPLPGLVDALCVSSVCVDPSRAWLCALAAAAGSALGCHTIYGAGYAGGELVLRRRVSEARLASLRRAFAQHPVFTVMLPAATPPAIAFKLAVLAAGVFRVPWRRFAPAIFAARLARFAALSMLAVFFGTRAMSLVSGSTVRTATAVLIAAGIFIAVLYLLRRVRSSAMRNSSPAEPKE